MTEKTANIYLAGRKAAGMTQERWAEMLGVSTEAVRQYEAGNYIPADEIARRMAEIAAMPVLAYWHLGRKSALARELLPKLSPVPLPQAVCALLAALDTFFKAEHTAHLLQIAADGRVDELEEDSFQVILGELDGIVRAALQVKYAQEEEDGAWRNS